MLYSKLSETYKELESTTKRLEKTSILSKFLISLTKDDSEIIYLLTGNVFPNYDASKIGISEQLVIRALGKVTGDNKEKINNQWKKIGDLGLVSEKLIKAKSQSTLHSSVLKTSKVLENLRKLPELEGQGTINKKISLISELLSSAKPLEAKYLVRTILGDLRIGIQESTIRDAMADAFFKESEKIQAKKKIQSALDKSNDLGKVFSLVKKSSFKSLDNVSIELGKPIKVMLAQKAPSISEGMKAVGAPCAVEYKYDGFRLLIHKHPDGKVELFTRRLENVTEQFPEVQEYVIKYVKGKSFILDSEAVGFDKKTKEYKPFQEISQRIRRKYNISELQKKLPIEVNVFDIIYYNGKSMLNKPLKERSELIRKIITNKPYKIITSKQIITNNEKRATKFYKKALEDNQEGVMFKNLNAIYQPGSRVGHMLKIKPEERDLDLVITGGEWGTGKRSGWLTSFIISCHDNKKQSYREIGKVATGLKEKKSDKSKPDDLTYEELTEKLRPLIKKEKGRSVEIKPAVVLSVTYQEIQKSPNYSSGFALRFPRFTALRPDKSSKDVSTLDEIKKDYENQSRNWKYG
ncbi:MAG: ATP-dependent DNA ligase [Nanoarchaeota archaeon]